MATINNESNSDSAISGGMLVILGIIVALAAVFFYLNKTGRFDSTPAVTIEMPNVEVPKADTQ